ncbi:MAG: glycosyltransferase family 4 protein [Anaerolineales bacterium]|nr:glycosyltransferase family 4 protein [Anaerolineales bacterium]
MLIISGAKGDTRRYRCFHLYEQFKLAALDCQIRLITDANLQTTTNWRDLVIFHRITQDALTERIFESIDKAGGVALMDVDDLLFEPAAYQWINSPDFEDDIRASLYQEDMRRFRNALQFCQGVLASTDYLAEQASALNLPVWVHRNAFSLEMLELSNTAIQQKKENGKPVVIGYASGTPTHDRDFALIKPVLIKILETHPQTELWLVGSVDAGKDWGSSAERVKKISLMPWRQLPQILARFDINLAPLVMDNPFSQSKSEIKYMEAGLVKTATIASPTQAFRYAIQSGKNGFLADTETGWLEALSAMVEHDGLREIIGEQAHEDVLTRYHPAKRSLELMDVIEQVNQKFEQKSYKKPVTRESASVIAFNLKGIDWRNFSVSPELEYRPSLLRRGIYTFRYRSAATLLQQIWIQIRRWVQPIFPFKKLSH